MNKKGHTEFVEKLYQMLDDKECSDYIKWSDNGKSFLMIKPVEFSTILQRHFRHKNLSSFVRQLNKYDFHKVKSQDKLTRDSGPQVWEFAHPYFQRNREDLLIRIKRKRSSNEKSVTNAPVVQFHGLETNMLFQDQVINTMKAVARYFQIITEDISELKALIMKERRDTAPRMDVLLAEDNLTCSVYAMSILKRHNCNVTAIEDSEHIFEVMKSESFDLIILSTNLSRIKNIIRNFRAINVVTPLILVSDRPAREGRSDFLSIGANEMIYKPYPQLMLIQLLDRYAGHRDGRQIN